VPICSGSLSVRCKNGFAAPSQHRYPSTVKMIRPTQYPRVQYEDNRILENPEGYKRILSATKNTCFENVFSKWSSFHEMQKKKAPYGTECMDAMREMYGDYPEIYNKQTHTCESGGWNNDRDFETNTTSDIHRLLVKLNDVKVYGTKAERKELYDKLDKQEVRYPVNPYHHPIQKMTLQQLKDYVHQNHPTTIENERLKTVAEYEKLKAMGWVLEYLAGERVGSHRACLVGGAGFATNNENPLSPITVKISGAVQKMFESDIQQQLYDRKVEYEARTRLAEHEKRKKEEEDYRRFENDVNLRMRQIIGKQ
jgi:hypothetical protein